MKSQIRFFSLVIYFISISIIAFTQPGNLDKSFGINGIVTTPIGNGDARITSIAIQSDTKIVAAGVSFDGFKFNFTMTRYDTNGSVDGGFGNDGIVITEIGSGNSSIRSLMIQPDEKLVVSGYAPGDSIYNFAIARYNADGSLDHFFGVEGITITSFSAYSGISASAIQSDGKIVAVGFMAASASQSGGKFALARYNTNGILDSTFGINGKMTTSIRNVNDAAYSVGIQSDGKIVLAGFSYKIDISGLGTDFALVRYNSNGTLDSTFGINGKVITRIGLFSLASKLILLEDNKIAVSGSTYNGSNWDFALARYNKDGSLDTTFGNYGIVTTAIGLGDDYGNSLMLQPDKKTITIGSSVNGLKSVFALVRHNYNGSLDTTFGINGIVTTAIDTNNSYLYASAMQTSGKILVAGATRVNDTISHFALARYISGLNLNVADNQGPIRSMFAFPNPVQQNTLLEYNLPSTEVVSIQLVDMNARTIKIILQNQQQEAGKHVQFINLPQGLSKGTYFIVLTTEKDKRCIKILK